MKWINPINLIKHEKTILSLAFACILFAFFKFVLADYNSHSESIELGAFTEQNLIQLTDVLNNRVPPTELYEIFNRYRFPMALFNLGEKPVIWNKAAENFEGEYSDSLGIYENDVFLGKLAIVKQTIPKTPPKKTFLFLLVCFIALPVFFNFKSRVFFFLIFSALTGSLFTNIEPLPIILMQIILLHFFIEEKTNSSLMFSAAYLVITVLSLNHMAHINPNFLDLHGSLESIEITIYLLTLIISTMMTFTTQSHFLIEAGTAVIAFFISPLYALFIVSVCIIKKLSTKETITEVLGKSLITALTLTCLLYSMTYDHMKTEISETAISEKNIEEKSIQDLMAFLENAETYNFGSLKDFCLETGLLDSFYDFELAYYNSGGELLDSISRGLPEAQRIPYGIEIENLSIAYTNRKLVAGSVEISTGIITLRLSADIYHNPLLSGSSPFSENIRLTDNASSPLEIVMPSGFKILSDVSLLSILFIIFSLTIYSRFSSNGNSLFEKAVLNNFTGFTAITIIATLLMLINSTRMMKKSRQEDMQDTAFAVKSLIEKDSQLLSSNYLKWIKTIFPGNYSIYNEGILTISSDQITTPVLMNARIYYDLISNSELSCLPFGNESLFMKIQLENMPSPILKLQSVDEIRQENQLIRTTRLFSIILLLILSASFIITRMFSMKITSPVEEISHSAKLISSGNYDVHISHQSNDELGNLSSSINEMSQSLKQQRNNLMALIENYSAAVILTDDTLKEILSNNHFKSLPEKVVLEAFGCENNSSVRLFIQGHHFTVTHVALSNSNRVFVIEDITEVVKVSRLTILTDMARKISHDIKNPLTPIRLNTEYLESVFQKKPENLPDVIPKVTSNILAKIDELKAISNQFSAFVKNEVTTTLTTIHIISFIKRQLNSYPELEYTIEGEEIAVIGSEIKLARVFSNLIENSISFVKDTTRIQITITDKNDFIEITYQDNGAGIPKENIRRVFEPYFSTRETGTGLGLFIVREFVEESGGQIEALPSKDGACFHITLKKA